MKKITLLAFMACVLLSSTRVSSQNNFIGEIKMFAGNFAPQGWARCEGQILPIQQNQALFSILGTTYGGDGLTTFALPDLRGRAPLHFGQGPGLTAYEIGQTGGTESNTLTVGQMPAHSHTVNAVTSDGNQHLPTSGFPANTKLLDKEYSSGTPNTTMNAAMIAPSGNGQPVNNVQPYIPLTTSSRYREFSRAPINLYANDI